MTFIKRTKHILLTLLVLVAMACTKNNDTALVPPPEAIDTSAVLQRVGSFANGPYGTVTGTIALYKQQDISVVSLSNFSTASGPDLHVYLSAEKQPIHFIDLGKLRQNSGDQLYAINGHPDLAYYNYVLIHCQQYNHLFGSALLK